MPDIAANCQVTPSLIDTVALLTLHLMLVHVCFWCHVIDARIDLYMSAGRDVCT